MERVYAFTDESGAFGWDLNNPSVSVCFVIAAVIVKERDIPELQAGVERIRKKYFQTGEMKSAKVGQRHNRRKYILGELLLLPFSCYVVVFDKSKLLEYQGLRYQKSFYKFLNDTVHRELRRRFQCLTIVADEIGGGPYMASFSDYVKKRTDILSLLNEAQFRFEKSNENILIQLADFIAGTIACEYDQNRKTEATPPYHSFLKNAVIEFYPKTYLSYVVDTSTVSSDEDSDIAQLCYNLAIKFIIDYENDDDLYRKSQIIIIKYLLFQFMYAEHRTYIATAELIEQLDGTPHANVSRLTFRTKIIGGLRDKNVIISGSSAKKGYKIPSKKSEVIDFVNHDTLIIMPMLSRLKKCRDSIKLGTDGKLDILSEDEYNTLQKFFDS